MPKYNANTTTVSNEKFNSKELESNTRFGERGIRVIDVNPSTPKRYDFLFQNNRIVGIRVDSYNRNVKDWSSIGTATPNDVPEYILEYIGNLEGEIVWANTFDFERCENFTRQYRPNTGNEEKRVESKTEKLAKSETEMNEDNDKPVTIT